MKNIDDDTNNIVNKSMSKDKKIWRETGRSEKIIGKWLKETGFRNKVIIATKGGTSEAWVYEYTLEFIQAI